ncbi:MAG TPA: hypothetical protein VKN99_16770 [Polyangia bacterium]|nr:hypothetical protein [Polyangia bacterium]
MAPGSYGLSISPFYSYGDPLVRIELLRDSASGSEVLAKTDHRFLDAAPARANLTLQVAKYVSTSDTLRLRVTAIDAGDPRYWLRLVLNAGSNERASSLSCPLRQLQ